MATINFYLDKRNQKKDGTYPLKLSVTHRKSFLLPLGISILEETWIGNKIEGNIPNKKILNDYLKSQYTKTQNVILKLRLEGILYGMTHNELKKEIEKELGHNKKEKVSPLHFVTYTERLKKRYINEDTKQQFTQTIKKISNFCDIEKLLISDITISWLKDFDAFCLNNGMTVNGKGVYLRNIRKVFNDAIDDELISYDKYPFRRFKIKRTATKHRNIPIERLREMLHFNQQEFIEREKLTANKHTSVFPNVQKYLDLFFLSFYLCGMNIKDLLFLEDEDIVNGQLSILRDKTNIQILLKIEPEAQALIDKYKGKKYLLNFLDTYSTDDYKSFLSKMNKAIQRAFPKITSYWARHSWATISAELDISDPIIDIAQGRKPKGMASIYINRNLKKVSQANRKVIDYLYGKIDIEE